MWYGDVIKSLRHIADRVCFHTVLSIIHLCLEPSLQQTGKNLKAANLNNFKCV